MTHPHPAGLRLPASDPAFGAPTQAKNAPRRRNGDMLMRRYHVSHLDPVSNTCIDQVKIAPAIPAFELAFAAMARGTLLAGPDGPVAIEDLRPGMLLETARKGACRIEWIGMLLGPENMLSLAMPSTPVSTPLNTNESVSLKPAVMKLRKKSMAGP